MKERFIVLVTTTPSLHAATRELATRLARRSDAVLLFLHVVPLQAADGEGMLHAAGDIRRTEAWVAAQEPSEPGVRFRHRHLVGEPEALVAGFVAQHAVELLIVEQPPRDFLSETLWRSFAERLVREVPCPVVIGGPGFLRGEPTTSEPVPSPLPPSTVADLLNAMVDARTEALRLWMDHAADAARRIAGMPVVGAVTQAHAGWQDPELRLQVALEEHRLALGASGWRLTRGDRAWTSGPWAPRPGPALSDFLRRIADHRASTSLPLPLDDAGDALVVLAGASVGDDGLLVLSFDAEAHFLRILGQPGPLPTFETYAFDRGGVMLSNSRFPEHLVAAGLLPDDDRQAPLRLRVAEPTDAPLDAWPLTLMARQAMAHGDGWNTRGYADYRGIEVVGAWRWVEPYGFGVVAEVDRDAAFP